MNLKLEEINQFDNAENHKNFTTTNKNYVKINNLNLSNNNNTNMKNSYTKEQLKKQNNFNNDMKK